jgi:integrase
MPKKSAGEFPRIVTHDKIKTLTAKIYRAENDGKYEYTLVYYNQDGERKRTVSRDLGALEARAGEVLDDLAGGKPVDASEALSAHQREEAANLRAIFAEANIAPLTGARHFVEGVKILGGVDLVIEACRAYAEHHTAKRGTVQEVVNEMIAAKRDRNRSAVHIKRLEQQLNAFAGSCVNVQIANAKRAVIQAFLDGLKNAKGESLGARSYNNYRASILQLFNFAKARGYVGNGWNEFASIDKEATPGGEVEVFTPDELETLLKNVDAEVALVVALGAWAGLRTAEALRLTWEDINTGIGSITVKGTFTDGNGKVSRVAKTGRRRIVPMLPVLRAYLEPARKSEGKIWRHSEPLLFKRLCRACSANKTGIEWKHNGLRHSFASYRLATTQNANQVALEMGNSAGEIFKSYNQLVTPAAAAKWFAIQPLALVESEAA